MTRALRAPHSAPLHVLAVMFTALNPSRAPLKPCTRWSTSPTWNHTFPCVTKHAVTKADYPFNLISRDCYYKRLVMLTRSWGSDSCYLHIICLCITIMLKYNILISKLIGVWHLYITQYKTQFLCNGRGKVLSLVCVYLRTNTIYTKFRTWHTLYIKQFIIIITVNRSDMS